MESLTKLGRPLFAIPMVFFGIQYLLYGRYVGGLPPVPPWAPGGRIGAYLVGAVLIAAGLSILANLNPRRAALVLGGLFLACVALLHSLHLHDVLYDGVARTRALEPLALSGAAFVLAAGARTRGDLARGTSSWTLYVGRFLFAFSMVIFGWQHFLYASFIATLIPAWMPAHLFLTYFTGVALIVAGIGIEIPPLRALAGFWLGMMFILWAVLLHAARVAAALHNGDEWTSAFIAVAMCGGSWIIARTSSMHPSEA